MASLAVATAVCATVLDVGSLRVHVDDRNLSNPILLSIPGNGGWNYLSDGLARRIGLSSRFALATYDMRGLQDGTECPTTWDVHVSDAAAIVRALHEHYGRAIAIFGFSTGTYVATRAATESGERVCGVIAMGMLVEMDESFDARMKEDMWNNLKLAGVVFDAARYLDSNIVNMNLGMVNEVYANFGIRKVAQLVSTDVAPDDTSKLARLAKAMMTIAAPKVDYARIRLHCPLHIIQGSSDTMGRADVLTMQLPRLSAPSKQVHWIPNAGHAPHITDPDLVASALGDIRNTLMACVRATPKKFSRTH